MKYHFITYATNDYMNLARNIINSAIDKGKFDTVKIYTPADIDIVFFNKNKNILNEKRGSGYWIWKPYIIQKRLNEIPEGDILCYCDSSYLFLQNIQRLSEKWLKNKNIAAANHKPNDVSFIEKNFTKKDAYILMNIATDQLESIKNSTQVWAGFVLLRKCHNSVRLIGEWLTYCQDERIVSDDISILGEEDDEFRENRHDQTVLSLLLKKWGLPMEDISKEFLFNIRKPL